MKTFLTFAAVCLLTISSMAAGRYPTVTIKTSGNFQISLDGRKFYNDNTIRLDRMEKGSHTIKVYKIRRGLYGTRTRLVSSRKFFVRNDDIRITINYNGKLDIDEVSNGRNRDRNRNDDEQDRRRDKNRGRW